MKENKLEIQINKPIWVVYQFCITPPNSTLWIPGVVKEETSEYPVKVGTIYFLTNNNGEISKVTVVDLKENQYVEWVSEDKNYHCSYTLICENNQTRMIYKEWVDDDQIEDPFTQGVLEKLKQVIEKLS
jgi:hypothetical protein